MNTQARIQTPPEWFSLSLLQYERIKRIARINFAPYSLRRGVAHSAGIQSAPPGYTGGIRS